MNPPCLRTMCMKCDSMAKLLSFRFGILQVFQFIKGTQFYLLFTYEVMMKMVLSMSDLKSRLYLNKIGQEEYGRLRTLCYADTHIILLCFAVDNPFSLENVESKWMNEISEFCP